MGLLQPDRVRHLREPLQCQAERAPPQRTERIASLLSRRAELRLAVIHGDDTRLEKLRDIEKQVRYSKKFGLRVYRQQLLDELDEAWKARAFSAVHRLARLLTRKGLGPERRRLRRPAP